MDLAETLPSKPSLSPEKEDQVLLQIARLIYDEEITIEQLYFVLGIELDDIGHSDPGHIVSQLSGIMTGWSNPHPHG